MTAGLRAHAAHWHRFGRIPRKCASMVGSGLTAVDWASGRTPQTRRVSSGTTDCAALWMARLDIVGVITLGMATAIGGGIIRDLLIGTATSHVQPLALPDDGHHGRLIAAGLRKWLHRLTRPLTVLDAAGLSLFPVNRASNAPRLRTRPGPSDHRGRDHRRRRRHGARCAGPADPGRTAERAKRHLSHHRCRYHGRRHPRRRARSGRGGLGSDGLLPRPDARRRLTASTRPTAPPKPQVNAYSQWNPAGCPTPITRARRGRPRGAT
jgi:hypothetical protein